MAKVTGFIAERLNLYGSFANVLFTNLISPYIENVAPTDPGSELGLPHCKWNRTNRAKCQGGQQVTRREQSSAMGGND